MAGRMQRDPIPPGWRECPCIGQVCPDYPLIPMKVPLGPTHDRIPHMYNLTAGHWSPEEALNVAHNMVVQHGGVVGMVLDLTNSNKYYDPREFTERSVRYCKVPCRGRGESPDPMAVNMAVWEIRKTLVDPRMYILVHCTHGFNRSGFIIISAAMRILAERGWCVERLFRRFAAQRPPGIYKHDYITDLFRRHNEHRPQVAKTPQLPVWKPGDDPDEDGGQLGPLQPKPAPPTRITHSDKVGELICAEEARWVLNVVYDALAGQDAWQRGTPPNSYPHYSVQHKSAGQSVIGSQPVSLDRENLELLRRKRYFVTWKADGTRYLMLLLKFGAYLIDRAGEVRRVHMRFPSRKPSSARKQGEYPMGPPHDYTLLDGEMVVDETDLAGQQQRRRFLIYDIMMLGGEGVADLRFAERYGLIEREVVEPRKEEAAYMQRHPLPTFRYDWAWEPFSVRRKEFWPLDKARSLLEKFIKQLCHESDGLILQPYDDPYIPKTYPHLLKWKFPHMNSVDFKLSFRQGSGLPELQLNCGHRRKFDRSSEVNHMSLAACGLGEQRVSFPEGVDPRVYDGKIVECAFNMAEREWVFMRERTDKDTANHRSVFDKVMTSITDNITEQELLQVFEDALTLPIYREEQQWRDGTHPSQLAQQQRAPLQQPQELPQHEQQQLADAAANGVAGAAAGEAAYDDGQQYDGQLQQQDDTAMEDAEFSGPGADGYEECGAQQGLNGQQHAGDEYDGQEEYAAADGAADQDVQHHEEEEQQEQHEEEYNVTEA